MTTKIIVTDDLTGEVIDPKNIHTIELRVTSGDYAGASVELDLSTESFEAKILELLDHGDLNKILGKAFAPSEPVVDAPAKKTRRPRHNHTYIHDEIEAEDLPPVLANHRILAGRRRQVAVNEKLFASVMRSGRVRIRQSFRLSNATALKDQLDVFGMDLVIHKTFRSVSNGKVLGVFGDIYAVPKSKF